MIVVDCPHCGCRLKVKDEWAGKKGKCPQCKASVLIGAADSSPPALSDKQPSGTTAPSASSSAETRQPASEPVDFLAPAQEKDELGRLGPFRVLKQIGAGGAAIVFAAEDSQLKRAVALKVLQPALKANAATRQAFIRAAQRMAALVHDHIVTIYHVGEDCGIPFLTMPLLQGQSLEQRLRQTWELPVEEVLRIGRETADALATAHEAGLVHGDIKPANIWMEAPKQRAKVLDFGLADAVKAPRRTPADLAYLAPEQLRGKAAGPRSDLFSLGCVLYHMSTGEVPFKGKDVAARLAAMGSPEPPRQINPQLTEDFSELILQLLAKDPAGRPASARAVLAAIEALEQGKPAEKTAVPVGPVTSDEWDINYRPTPEVTVVARRKSRRIRRPSELVAWVVGGISVLIVLVAAVVLVGTQLKRRLELAQAPPPPPAVDPDVAPEETRRVSKLSLPPQTPPKDGAEENRRVKNPAPPQATPLPSPPRILGGPPPAPPAGNPPTNPVVIAEVTGAQRYQINGPFSSTNAFALLGDGKTLAIPMDNLEVAVLDCATGKRLRTLGQFKVEIRGMACTGNGRVVAAVDNSGSIRVWDLSAAKGASMSQRGKQAGFGPTALSPDGTLLAVTTNEINVWNVAARKARLLPREFVSHVSAVAFSPDGKVLATGDGSSPGVVTLWDLENNQKTDLAGHIAPITAIAFSSDQKSLATASSDCVIKLWDLDSRKLRANLTSHQDVVSSVAFSPDGTLLVSAAGGLRWGRGKRGEVKVWDTGAGKLLANIRGHTDGVTQVAFNQDGTEIVSVGRDNTVRFWMVAIIKAAIGLVQKKL